MRDLLFVAIVIAFFALATVYVRVCAWVVGEPDVGTIPDEVAR
jgi:hypothetical protein